MLDKTGAGAAAMGAGVSTGMGRRAVLPVVVCGLSTGASAGGVECAGQACGTAFAGTNVAVITGGSMGCCGGTFQCQIAHASAPCATATPSANAHRWEGRKSAGMSDRPVSAELDMATIMTKAGDSSDKSCDLIQH